jgi:hypothetical protein
MKPLEFGSGSSPEEICAELNAVYPSLRAEPRRDIQKAARNEFIKLRMSSGRKK